MYKYSRPESECDLRRLKENFYTHDGKLYAKRAYSGRVKIGQEVGTTIINGRRTVMCNYKQYFVHRIIYYLTHDTWPVGVVDHINGDPLDNRPENLRDVSHKENVRSFRKIVKPVSSNYRGVHWDAKMKKWHAQASIDNKRKHLGYFESEKEAALVWNFSALKLGYNKEAFNKVF